MNLHANAALSLKGRRELCRRVVERTLAQAAEAAGVSVRCARKWVGRYRAEGEAGLRDRSSAPHRIPHRSSEQRVEAIAALRRLRFTGPEIAEVLGMALSTVSGILARIGMAKLGRKAPVASARVRARNSHVGFFGARDEFPKWVESLCACRCRETRRLTMTVIITAFERSPDGGMGLARDTRVRWALEEVGQPYEVRLVSLRAKQEPAHLRLHPFGLIPTYEEGDLALFETGAIVLHIAEHHAGLFPDDANARARAITWMFAALNTVEPPILELVTAKILEGDRAWADERLPLVKDRIRDRLVQLSARLGDADWLDGAFSAGDLMMVSVLLRLRPSGVLDESPKLAAYVARGEARPAYKRAFAAQWAINAAGPQAG
jgi:glutathione S-transferase